MGDRTYRSQIDKWLLIVFVVSTVASLGVFVAMIFMGFAASSLVMIPVLLAAAVLPWWIFATTDYTVTNHTLEIRSGPFRWSIAFRDITGIEFTRSPASSPALSLHRLRIQYKGGALIMISPENREQFLADLRSRGVGVQVRR